MSEKERLRTLENLEFMSDDEDGLIVRSPTLRAEARMWVEKYNEDIIKLKKLFIEDGEWKDMPDGSREKHIVDFSALHIDISKLEGKIEGLIDFFNLDESKEDKE